MFRFALKNAALIAASLSIAISLTACGGDNDEPSSDSGRLSGPSKISYNGVTLAKFSYDSEGRMTSLVEDDIKMTLTYSPLTFKFVDESDVMTFENIELNSQGYMVRAYITDIIGDEVDKYWATCTYDAAGHWTGNQMDGESSVITWSEKSIRFDEDDDEGYTIIRLSDVKNPAGVFSPNWGVLGLYGMTGLFGKAPDYFPSSMAYIDPEDDDDARIDYKYLLLADGRIGKESLTMDGMTVQLTYSYPTRSTDDTFYGDASTVSAKKFKNIFKRKRK